MNTFADARHLLRHMHTQQFNSTVTDTWRHMLPPDNIIDVGLPALWIPWMDGGMVKRKGGDGVAI